MASARDSTLIYPARYPSYPPGKLTTEMLHKDSTTEFGRYLLKKDNYSPAYNRITH